MAENGQSSSLSRAQEKALAALLAQPTIALAAASAQVGERTLYRWLAEHQAFQAEYRRMRRQVLNNAIWTMQRAADKAVAVAISLMSDPETPSSTRLAAARAVLELSLEFLKVEELEERLRLLEERLEGNAAIGIQTVSNRT
jgi:hypothetical protein